MSNELISIFCINNSKLSKTIEKSILTKPPSVFILAAAENNSYRDVYGFSKVKCITKYFFPFSSFILLTFSSLFIIERNNKHCLMYDYMTYGVRNALQ